MVVVCLSVGSSLLLKFVARDEKLTKGLIQVNAFALAASKCV